MSLNFVPGTDEESVEWDTISLSGTTYSVAGKFDHDTQAGSAGFEQGAPGTANSPLDFQLVVGTDKDDAGFRVRDDAGVVLQVVANFTATGTWVTSIGTRSGDDLNVYGQSTGTALVNASGTSAGYGTITSARLLAGALGDTNNTKGGPTAAEYDGRMAELAVWDGIVLTASERNAYHAGVSPLMIRPEALVFYVPLWANTNAAAHENIATATNYNPIFNGTPDAADHPPVGRLVHSPANYNLSPNANQIGPVTGNVQIAGRKVLSPRTVYLYDRQSGALLQSTTTDVNGDYEFKQVNGSNDRDHYIVVLDNK